MKDLRLNDSIIARRCACKGFIIAPENPSPETAEKVARHRAEEPHRSWDAEDWVERNTAQVDVRTTLRRVA